VAPVMLLLALIGAGWLVAIVMCLAVCAAAKRIDTQIDLECALMRTREISSSGYRRSAEPVR
jgi:hypothetical protein